MILANEMISSDFFSGANGTNLQAEKYYSESESGKNLAPYNYYISKITLFLKQY